jgi:formate--tetrahydrofolate ligase
VLVATVRALKMNGGASKNALKQEDISALERGLPNLERHIENVRQFGVPVVVGVNRFTTDSDRELQMVAECAERAGAHVALNEVWEKGGEGGVELARAVMSLLGEGKARFAPIYEATAPIREKIDTIVPEGVRRGRRRLRTKGRAFRFSISSPSVSVRLPFAWQRRSIR